MTGDPILVIDDNPQNMKLIVFLLVKCGYDVRTAVDAEDGLRALRDFRPRLILMDLQMPGMDGLTLTRQLKADPQYSGIIIVAVTASAMKGDEARAREAGCDGYITKPIDTRALPHIIESFLAAGRGPS